MKVIIAGSRGVNDITVVTSAMDMASIFGIDATEVVSGKARGVDTLGETWAARRAIPVKAFPARWRDTDGTYYPGAGHARNTDMAKYADALVAVWDGESKGTADMIKKARKLGLLVWVHDFNPANKRPGQS